MSPRIRNEQHYEMMRDRLMDAAFELIRHNGLTHASVEKIAQACGIGKGTFYHYFPSKEALIYALSEKQRLNSEKHFFGLLAGRDKMTVDEGKEYIKFVINRDDTIYRYLTGKYMEKLQQELSAKEYEQIRPGERNSATKVLLEHIEGVKTDVDLPLVSNLIKVISYAFLKWDEDLLMPKKEEISDMIYEHLFTTIFEETR